MVAPEKREERKGEKVKGNIAQETENGTVVREPETDQLESRCASSMAKKEMERARTRGDSNKRK